MNDSIQIMDYMNQLTSQLYLIHKFICINHPQIVNQAQVCVWNDHSGNGRTYRLKNIAC